MKDAELVRLADEIVARAQLGADKLAAAVEHIEALDRRDAEILAKVNEARERMGKEQKKP